MENFQLTTNVPYGTTTINPSTKSPYVPPPPPIKATYNSQVSDGISYVEVDNANSVLFSVMKGYNRFWNAFQGVVYVPKADSEVSSCLFNGEVLNLADSKKIIPLISLGNLQKSENCVWKINIPKFMSLKVVVRNKQDENSLTVTADDGTLNYLTNNTVRYFNGTSFTLTYVKQVFSSDQTFSMVVLISAVPIAPNNVIQCYRKISDKHIDISSQNCTLGYPNSVVSPLIYLK